MGGGELLCQCCGLSAVVEVGAQDQGGEYVGGTVRLCDFCSVMVWKVLDARFDEVLALMGEVSSARGLRLRRDRPAPASGVSEGEGGVNGAEA